MDGRNSSEVIHLRLVPESGQPVPQASRFSLTDSIKHWLGLDRMRANRTCVRQGHVPVRTASGTWCERCTTHWEHA